MMGANMIGFIQSIVIMLLALYILAAVFTGD
jgi:hypothetical protein